MGVQGRPGPGAEWGGGLDDGERALDASRPGFESWLCQLPVQVGFSPLSLSFHNCEVMRKIMISQGCSKDFGE